MSVWVTRFVGMIALVMLFGPAESAARAQHGEGSTRARHAGFDRRFGHQEPPDRKMAPPIFLSRIFPSIGATHQDVEPQEWRAGTVPGAVATGRLVRRALTRRPVATAPGAVPAPIHILVCHSYSGQNDDQSHRALATNIITDRLTGKDLRRWNAIKRIVFAEDAEGQSLHPTLRSLWERLERSGHTIYIEMGDTGRAISNTAGVFRLEQFDPEGIRHVAVIRLYPGTIDRAYVGPNAARAEGFIPFQGLNKVERYAEVLGHELAHAVHILSDLTRAQMVEEIVQQTNESFLSYGRRYGYANIESEMRQRIAKRDAFLKELEEPAEAAEMSVWREIVSSRAARNMAFKKKNFSHE